jgi:hypothetical protein
MPRTRRTAPEGYRICNRCDQRLPATRDIFVADASRVLGIAYECRACHSARKEGRDRRKERWSAMTPEQRDKAKARNAKYNKTDKGRAVFLRKAYDRTDKCDLTTAEVLHLITKPCVYCGTQDSPRGLDRIDNARPHIKGNVRPACAPCNFARGDRFTAEEMDLIGATIRLVMERRKAHGYSFHGS